LALSHNKRCGSISKQRVAKHSFGVPLELEVQAAQLNGTQQDASIRICGCQAASGSQTVDRSVASHEPDVQSLGCIAQSKFIEQVNVHAWRIKARARNGDQVRDFVGRDAG
jgi:hypothetical protein